MQARIRGRSAGSTPRVVVVAAVVSVAAIGAGIAVSLAGGATKPSASATSLQRDFIRIVKSVSPSVVEISTTEGLGSGVVYDNRGDIVTNAHVVGTAKRFTVTTSNGKRRSAALVGSYAPDDLAVVRATDASGLHPAQFTNTAAVAVGKIVLAIGSPLGLSTSVTDGIVSATARDVVESEGVVLPDLIQTSAPINPGNSGGALVELSGKVIGIPTLAATSGTSGAEAIGIGFAIPSSTVRLIAPQLIRSGKVTNAGRASLGVSGTTVADFSGNPLGVLVESVTSGGPAAKAGIVAGELIVGLGTTAVHDLNGLEVALAKMKPGATTTVRVASQSGGVRDVRVVLGNLAG